MRKELVLVLLLALSLLSVPLLASNAGAVSTTILPGGSYKVTLTLSEDTTVTYHWTSDAVLDFEISNPSGSVVRNVSSSNHVGFYDAPSSGTYVFRWTNPQSVSVGIEYDITTMSISEDFFDALSPLFIGVLVAAIMIVAVIVVIVVVLVMKEKPAAPTQQAQMPMQPPQYVPHPVVGGKCPMCGAPADSSALFCQKCGAKLR